MKYLLAVSLYLIARCAAVAQSDSAKEAAVRQMRLISEAIKMCPEEVQSQTDVGVYYYGPPSNVEWDVMPSKTVRSPFQGWIEFSLPRRSQETDKAKRSKKLHERYMDADIYQATYGHSGHFRYEFDLGADSPHLIKMSWFDDKTQSSEVAPASRACWQEAARSAASRR